MCTQQKYDFIYFVAVLFLSASLCISFHANAESNAKNKDGHTSSNSYGFGTFDSIGSPHPVQLIYRAQSKGKLAVNQDAVALLEQFPNCVVVSVTGMIRTGKSFFANQLRGSMNGFVVGHTELSRTQGIWIWGQPLLIKDIPVMLMDFEGFGGLETDDDYEALLFSLLVSTSHHMVYHSEDVDRLEIANIERFSRRAAAFILQALSQRSDLSDWLEKGPASSMPSMTWVVSRFVRELTRSPDSWLNETIHAEAGRYRIALNSVFPNISCFVMPPPLRDSSQYRLDEMPSTDLKHDFVTAMSAIISRLSLLAEQSSFPVSAITVLHAMDALLETISKFPQAASLEQLQSVPTEWKSFHHRHIQSVANGSLQFCQGHFALLNKTEEIHGPFETKQMFQNVALIINRTNDHFAAATFHDHTPAVEAAYSVLSIECDLHKKSFFLSHNTRVQNVSSQMPLPPSEVTDRGMSMINEVCQSLQKLFDQFSDEIDGFGTINSHRSTMEEKLLEAQSKNKILLESVFSSARDNVTHNFSRNIKSLKLPIHPDQLERQYHDFLENAITEFNGIVSYYTNSDEDNHIGTEVLKELKDGITQLYTAKFEENCEQLSKACFSISDQLTRDRNRVLENISQTVSRLSSRLEMMRNLETSLHKGIDHDFIQGAEEFPCSTCHQARRLLLNHLHELEHDVSEAYQTYLYSVLRVHLTTIVDKYVNATTIFHPVRYLYLRPLVFRAAMKELEDVVPDVSFRTELVEDWLALKLNPLSKIMKNSLKDLVWTAVATAAAAFLVITYCTVGRIVE
eukprot:gene593-3907_t